MDDLEFIEIFCVSIDEDETYYYHKCDAVKFRFTNKTDKKITTSKVCAVRRISSGEIFSIDFNEKLNIA